MVFSSDLVDPSRLARALEPNMTPLDIEDGTGTFASGEGVLYYANLEDCSCPDFRYNQRMQKPCKHIIRMAMEEGVYPSSGIKSDRQEALSMYHVGVLERFMKTGPIPDNINAFRILSRLLKPGLKAEEDEVLAFAGIPKLTESGLAEIKGKTQKITLFSTKKKAIKALSKTLASRLGEFILDNLDNPAVLDFFELAAKEEEDAD